MSNTTLQDISQRTQTKSISKAPRSTDTDVILLEALVSYSQAAPTNESAKQKPKGTGAKQ